MISRLVRTFLCVGMAAWLITAGLTPTEWLSAGQLILLVAFLWTGVRGLWVPGVIHRAQTAYLTRLIDEVRRERDAYAVLLAEATRTTSDAVDTITDLIPLIPREDRSC